MLFLLVSGCADEEQFYRADFMKDCFNSQDLKLLNEGVGLFEEIMLEKYSQANRDEIYKMFAADFGAMKLTSDTYTQPKVKAFLERVSSSGLSRKIWVRKNFEGTGVYMVDADERNSINHYYSTSTQLDFFKCIFSKVKEGGVARMLKVVNTEGDLSPDFLAIGITYLDEKALQTNSLKVFVAYAIFYESAMTLNFR